MNTEETDAEENIFKCYIFLETLKYANQKNKESLGEIKILKNTLVSLAVENEKLKRQNFDLETRLQKCEWIFGGVT